MWLRHEDDQVPVVLGLRMSRVIRPFLLYAFMACIGTTLLFPEVTEGRYKVIW